MSARDFERYKQLLLAKRRGIKATAIGTMGAAGGAAECPRDVIEQATQDTQTALQVRLRQTDSRLWRAIEEALERIDRNTFGVCEVCRRPISPARLDAVPWTRLCRDCKEQQA